jgi:hypothetical protein
MKAGDFRSKLVRIWIDDVNVCRPSSVELRYLDGVEAFSVSIGLCEKDGDCPCWLHLKESPSGVSLVRTTEPSLPPEPFWQSIPSDTDSILGAMLDFVDQFETRKV